MEAKRTDNVKMGTDKDLVLHELGSERICVLILHKTAKV